MPSARLRRLVVHGEAGLSGIIEMEGLCTVRKEPPLNSPQFRLLLLSYSQTLLIIPRLRPELLRRLLPQRLYERDRS
jgi:hypothetical protein